MATAVQGAKGADRQWYIVERWQEYEGEGKTNLLRIIAIGAFYLVELAQYHWFQPTGVDASDLASYHQKVTALAVAWTMVSLAVLLCLRLRVFPAFLKYVTTACDLLLLTALASVDHGAKSTAPDGPASPLVLVFFLILALASLRVSVGLVWFATIGSMAGYLTLVGLADKKWFDQDHVVPIVTQVITVLSLALTGVVLGQIVRRAKSLAEEYAIRKEQAART